MKHLSLNPLRFKGDFFFFFKFQWGHMLSNVCFGKIMSISCGPIVQYLLISVGAE